jgi:hypothetical protein
MSNQPNVPKKPVMKTMTFRELKKSFKNKDQLAEKLLKKSNSKYNP